ncbi:MAG: hypothetical protein KBC62_00055 [Candidatus Pacebacteria bacterium]|nr:hypothetical protein [Candidatus Paceibacterota bacterium]MBP9842383.1 hypothetical protein [Candidatus Paceibacterota bacterium]
MARMVLLVATTLALSACEKSPQPEDPQATKVNIAREQEISTFRTNVNSLENPDEVLALSTGKKSFSEEINIINDRLLILIRPRIEGAKTREELRELKKYTLPGSSLIIHYMQRDSELSREEK